jgi:choline dehydrogenase
MVRPRGKVLGGTSAINGLVYIRGQREDFYRWHALGNGLWGYDDVLPHFRAAEDNQRGAGTYHGGDGPLEVSDSMRSELGDAYIRACEQAGIVANDDFNGAQQEGAGYFQLTVTRRGRRASTGVAYLKKAKTRTNLTIETHALAQCIEFQGKRATGVNYQQNAVTKSVSVDKEVIVCGGAINSPQLLQLSGVGPADLLREHGINVVHDLPGVGENLQDHYQIRAIYKCSKPITLNDVANSIGKRVAAGIEYALFRRGPLTVGAGQIGVFARTRPELESPDVQFHFIPFSADGPGNRLHAFPAFTVSVCQLRPESRGFVRIRSNQASDHPVIQPNYLTTDGDVQTMLDGLKLVRDVSGAEAIKPYIVNEHLPGPECASDDQLVDYIRGFGGTIFHPAGTCKMGNDELAVVDEQLRVHGIEGLRVADASIMPTVLSGNTNAGCIMIGEKLSAMMLGR